MVIPLNSNTLYTHRMTELAALADRLLTRFAAELDMPAVMVEPDEGDELTKARVPITFLEDREELLTERVAELARRIQAESAGRSLLMAELPHPVTADAVFPRDEAGHVARVIRSYVIAQDDYAYAFDVLYGWQLPA